MGQERVLCGSQKGGRDIDGVLLNDAVRRDCAEELLVDSVVERTVSALFPVDYRNELTYSVASHGLSRGYNKANNNNRRRNTFRQEEGSYRR